MGKTLLMGCLLVLAAASVFTRCAPPNPNEPPNQPFFTAAPDSGVTDSAYSFLVRGTDPDSQKLRVRVDWGDGSVSAWSAPVALEPNCECATEFSHSWSHAGDFDVTAQTQDPGGLTSPWSLAHRIRIKTRF